MIMRRKFTYLFSVCIFLVSCSDFYQTKLNGQWQLLNITYPSGTITDDILTQFYSFQYERLFSYTTLLTPDSSSISYGYINFPDPDVVLVSMDTTGLSAGSLRNIHPKFLEYSGWDSYQKKFDITFNDKTMTLRDEKNIVYIFKKY